jgi:tetratricopeptide (TPR) repeat protein
VLALVFVVLAGAAIVGSVLSGGDDESSAPSRADRTPAEPAKPKQKKKEEQQAKQEPRRDEPAAAPAPAEPAEPAPTEAAPTEDQTVSYDSGRGAALNDQGFALMNQERYDEAIPVLQQAVESFPPGTDNLNYAYALYNLGRSLRLAGRPDEAIPILEQRLQIQNQTATVQRELDLARQAAGQG